MRSAGCLEMGLAGVPPRTPRAFLELPPPAVSRPLQTPVPSRRFRLTGHCIDGSAPSAEQGLA